MLKVSCMQACTHDRVDTWQKTSHLHVCVESNKLVDAGNRLEEFIVANLYVHKPQATDCRGAYNV